MVRLGVVLRDLGVPLLGELLGLIPLVPVDDDTHRRVHAEVVQRTLGRAFNMGALIELFLVRRGLLGVPGFDFEARIIIDEGFLIVPLVALSATTRNLVAENCTGLEFFGGDRHLRMSPF